RRGPARRRRGVDRGARRWAGGGARGGATAERGGENHPEKRKRHGRQTAGSRGGTGKTCGSYAEDAGPNSPKGAGRSRDRGRLDIPRGWGKIETHGRRRSTETNRKKAGHDIR